MPRILLVEDSKVQALLAKKVLESAGYEVIHAATGEAALKSCYENPPDIVLQDQHLVEMSGLEVCRRIKSEISLTHIPVLALTAGDAEKDHVASLNAGADAFLPKGGPPQKLLTVIARLIKTAAKQKPIQAGADSENRPRPTRILAIDDSPTYLEVLCQKLTEAGFEVVGVPSGADGLARLREESFDVAVVDVVMPEMNGFEFCQQARQWSDDENAALGLLVLTGADRQDVLVEALEAGADDYATKLAEMDVILAHATALARRISRVKQLERVNAQVLPQNSSESNDAGEVRKSIPALGASLSGISDAMEQLSRTSLTAEQQEFLNSIRQSADAMSQVLDELTEGVNSETG